ncbi:MAG: helix-turn-helix transcriptional regulator [Alphaproteobacteria bacterium]|nr:helix-turn-helix transcriptional regulator [Alphaproteobacteria bacterium]
MSKKGKSGDVDIVIGRNISFVRKQKNITQEELAKKLGITFQQIQKYENGKNRVSASNLMTISKILDVPLTCFFSEMLNVEDLSKSQSVPNLFSSDTLKILRLLEAIKNKNVKRQLITFIESFVNNFRK